MKIHFLSFVVITLFITALGQLARAQHLPNDSITMKLLNGKKLYAMLGESCNELSNGGGFMSYSFCVLKFNKNKITVKSYSARSNVYDSKDEPVGIEAVYTLKGDTLIVPGVQFLPLILDYQTTFNFESLRIYTPYDYFRPKDRRVYFNDVNK